MKIYIPDPIQLAHVELLVILKVIFRDSPKNFTRLWETFVPNKIEWKETKPSRGRWAVKIRFWSEGIYVDVVSEAEDRRGSIITSLKIKTEKDTLPDDWLEFEVPVRDILQPEDNFHDGIPETDPQQVRARAKQVAAVQAVHQQLR